MIDPNSKMRDLKRVKASALEWPLTMVTSCLALLVVVACHTYALELHVHVAPV